MGLPSYRILPQTTTDYRRQMSMFTPDQRKLQENVKLTSFTQIRNINGRCARRPRSVFYNIWLPVNSSHGQLVTAQNRMTS